MELIKPMLPTLASEIPNKGDWIHEVKYDGFRALLHLYPEKIILQSRNQKILNDQFPEIIDAARVLKEKLKNLPLILDGELCILESVYKASFEQIQLRGRLKNKVKIQDQLTKNPAKLLIFDLLAHGNERYFSTPFKRRKELLIQFAEQFKMDSVSKQSSDLIQVILHTSDIQQLINEVISHDGEGIVSKRLNSNWIIGKRTTDWLKNKNYKYGLFIVTGFDQKNGFFHVAVRKDDDLISVGLFSHGLEGDNRKALIEIMKQNATTVEKDFYKVPPKIVVELQYLEIYQNQLRHPRFHQFRFDVHWEDCTWQELKNNKGCLRLMEKT